MLRRSDRGNSEKASPRLPRKVAAVMLPRTKMAAMLRAPWRDIVRDIMRNLQKRNPPSPVPRKQTAVTL